MAQTAFILVVGDEDGRGTALANRLTERHGHACLVAPTIDDALDSIRGRAPDAVVIDGLAFDRDAVERVARLLESLSRDATLLVAGDDTVPTSRQIRVQALSAALDGGRLANAIHDAAVKAVARREDRLLREQLAGREDESFEGIVGESPAIRKIIERIRRAARTKLNVLIVGESGTGKELIARAIHNTSDRARKPFKALNCAAVQDTLLESTLFGHVKGAFTGAISEQKGFFQAADGGTLFLDEIGDMPLTMQAKLLRALDQREITPVGSTDVIHVDVRVVAATNRDLADAVDRKQFRGDLYYRLREWPIDVPALRERRGDIPLLSLALLKRISREHNLRVYDISSEAIGLLSRYLWPGNVRELHNVLARVATEVSDRRIEADDLPEEIRGSRELAVRGGENFVGMTMQQVERLMIEKTLQATGGNREQAAKMLGIGIRTLYRKLKEFEL